MQPCLLMLGFGLIATFSVHGRPAAWKTEVRSSWEMAVPHRMKQRLATKLIPESSVTSTGRALSFCGLIEMASGRVVPGLLGDAVETMNGHEILPEAALELEQMIEMWDNVCWFCGEVDMWATIGVAMGWAPQWAPQ